MLPEPILRDVQHELLDWQGTGMSILEIGHRTPEFMQLMAQLEHKLRILLNIPSSYHVMFLGGAARTQFGMLPQNLLTHHQQAAYLVTGLWSKMAFEEAQKIKKAYCAASSENDGFVTIPDRSHWQVDKQAAYLYYTPNETVNGVRFPQVPVYPDTPLIADMTSCLFSEPINIEDYGVIFAGAQKNIANAGLTLVIMRDEVLQSIKNNTLPTMMDYRTHVQNKSLYATPPTFNCYLALKMMDWIEEQGGVEKLYRLNCKKSAMLYDFIDASPFYECNVKPDARSLVNVCFRMNASQLEERFVEKAKKVGLVALKGHRMAGGLRASLYNSMPVEGVVRLVQFMEDFAQENCK